LNGVFKDDTRVSSIAGQLLLVLSVKKQMDKTQTQYDSLLARRKKRSSDAKPSNNSKRLHVEQETSDDEVRSFNPNLDMLQL
jgi:hypothetical protein